MFFAAFALATLPGAGFGYTVASVAPADGGKLLFVAMEGFAADTGRVCVWDLGKPELKAVVTGLPADTRTVRPTADRKRFVLVCGDEWRVSRVEVWSVAEKKRLHSFDVAAKNAGQATVSPDGNWVAYRTYRDKSPLRVWNTDTGRRAEEIEKAAAKGEGALAFTTDSKRLISVTTTEYTEFDLATGKTARTWKRGESVERVGLDRGGGVAALPDGKGVVTVSATAKRRQSYVVHLVAEKADYFLGEFWDAATAPVVSPDGRLLIVSGGRDFEADTFALKLDADGAPETEDAPAKPVGPFVRGRDAKVPAWRAWGVTVDATRGGRELPGALAFAPDGGRLFVGGRLGRTHVFDIGRRVPTAALFATMPTKDELPAWHIVTAAGEFVGSPAEAEALAKDGKVQDATKVKAALGVK